MISEFALPINESELRDEMDSWLSELDEGADSILARVNERHRTVCLSNINDIQWPRIRDDLGLGKWFSEQFLSYEIGLVKPDPEIYSHVATSRYTLTCAHRKPVFMTDIGRGPQKALDLQVLLDPFEEQLDLPARLIDRGHLIAAVR